MDLKDKLSLIAQALDAEPEALKPETKLEELEEWDSEKERCGICVTPESPIEIANAIEYLLTHPDEAEAMGKRGQEAVRKLYNWEIESKKLRAFYEKILTGKGADVSGHF